MPDEKKSNTEAPPKEGRKMRKHLSYTVSLIVGISSNVWKAGGLWTIHSKVVESWAPASEVHGLVAHLVSLVSVKYTMTKKSKMPTTET